MVLGGMMYRQNAMENNTMDDQEKGFWKRTYKRATAYAIMACGLLIGGSIAYGIVSLVRSPAKPYQCSEKAYRIDIYYRAECDQQQYLERGDGWIYCRCYDHKPANKAEAQ